MKILVTPTSLSPNKPTPALKALQDFADEIIYNPHGRPLNEKELKQLLPGCHGYIAGLDSVSADAISSGDCLKVISRYGAGVDRVDVREAKHKGITVCNTPGANAQAVADLTMGLILSVARKIPMLNEKTKNGQWVRSTGMELYGKTIGILGLGAIGKAVAKRAQGFSMDVLAYDPFMDMAYAKENGIASASFEEVVKASHIISLHLPLMESTRHILSADVMQSMKPGALIINTARGGLLDEDAACRFLQSGQLGGLGLDAFEQEPPEKSALMAFDNVVMTPHTASHTYEATACMASMAVQNLIDVLSGKACRFTV